MSSELRRNSLSTLSATKVPPTTSHRMNHTTLHFGHNYTQHIPNTADASGKPLVNSITKYEWSLQKSPKHIAAHIDHVKFGREDYGYGFGKVNLTSRDVLADTTSSKWGAVPKFKTPEPPSYRLSEVDRFNPTDFE